MGTRCCSCTPTTQALWQHLKTCRHYKNCPVKHCQSSRSLLTHYRRCQSQGKTATCDICGPVVLFDREQHNNNNNSNNNNIRKKTKREGKAKNNHKGLVAVKTVHLTTNNSSNSNSNSNRP